MQLLCASNSMVFVQSLRIALEGEGIETFCSGVDMPLLTIVGPIGGGAGRVYVLHEADWPRAVEIFRQMSPSPPPAPADAQAPQRMPRWLSIGLVMLIMMAVVLMLALTLS